MARLALIATLLLTIGLLLANCAPPFIEASVDVGYTHDELMKADNDSDYAVAYRAVFDVLTHYVNPPAEGQNAGPSQFDAQVKFADLGETHNRIMYVNSRVNGDFGAMTRVQVRGFVVRGEFNQIEPRIEVWQQMRHDWDRPGNPSGTALFGAADGQNRWINIGRNAYMEARLTNLVMEQIDGQGNAFSGRMGLDTRPYVIWNPVDHPVPDGFTPRAAEPDMPAEDNNSEMEQPAEPEGEWPPAETPADGDESTSLPFRVPGSSAY